MSCLTGRITRNKTFLFINCIYYIQRFPVIKASEPKVQPRRVSATQLNLLVQCVNVSSVACMRRESIRQQQQRRKCYFKQNAYRRRQYRQPEQSQRCLNASQIGICVLYFPTFSFIYRYRIGHGGIVSVRQWGPQRDGICPERFCLRVICFALFSLRMHWVRLTGESRKVHKLRHLKKLTVPVGLLKQNYGKLSMDEHVQLT